MANSAAVATTQLIALAVLLLWAVLSDLRHRRIPNALVLTGITLALASHLAAAALARSPLAGAAWWAPLTGLAAGFVLLLPLYLLRAMGAGDVKLLATVGAFIGPSAVISAFVYTLLAGGLLSLAFMLGRGVAAQTLSNLRYLLTDWGARASTGQGLRLAPLASTAARLPYALAISLGTAAALVWPLLGG
ncbi:MAG: A24 family peptidase [Pseudomonadota bacterium]